MENESLFSKREEKDDIENNQGKTIIYDSLENMDHNGPSDGIGSDTVENYEHLEDAN